MPTASVSRTARHYITVCEAADRLSVTERTIRNFIARGELTGYRMGSRAIRIDPRELDNVLTVIPTAGRAA